MASKDFGGKTTKPQGNDNLYGPDDQGGAPKTGFSDAPAVAQDRGGPGPGVPANKSKIS